MEKIFLDLHTNKQTRSNHMLLIIVNKIFPKEKNKT